jgi:hypothetical protein
MLLSMYALLSGVHIKRAAVSPTCSAVPLDQVGQIVHQEHTWDVRGHCKVRPGRAMQGASGEEDWAGDAEKLPEEVPRLCAAPRDCQREALPKHGYRDQHPLGHS